MRTFAELKTQSSLDHPDGICQDECNYSSFGCRHHMLCRAQGLSGIISLELCFECVVTNGECVGVTQQTDRRGKENFF